MLLAEHALVDEAVVAARDADYDAGRSGSRDLMQWDMEVLPRDGALLREFAAAIPQDHTFVSFVAAVQDAGAAIEIVSDGLGFYVASNLARLDPALADLPVATNDNDVDGDGRLTFPWPSGLLRMRHVQRERVRAHEVAGAWRSSSATATATATPPTTRHRVRQEAPEGAGHRARLPVGPLRRDRGLGRRRPRRRPAPGDGRGPARLAGNAQAAAPRLHLRSRGLGAGADRSTTAGRAR
jgi:hypothetical protein